tara:strand:- start:221 stop:748 length:528 start_codon:yes stop_codon:yes gene_type:complete
MHSIKIVSPLNGPTTPRKAASLLERFCQIEGIKVIPNRELKRSEVTWNAIDRVIELPPSETRITYRNYLIAYGIGQLIMYPWNRNSGFDRKRELGGAFHLLDVAACHTFAGRFVHGDGANSQVTSNALYHMALLKETDFAKGLEGGPKAAWGLVESHDEVIYRTFQRAFELPLAA